MYQYFKNEVFVILENSNLVRECKLVIVLVAEIEHQMPNSLIYISTVSEDILAVWCLLFSVCVKNKDVLTVLLEYLA